VQQSSPAKSALQAAVALAATLPIVASAFDVLHGVQGADAWAVNHERYLSGLLFAIGLGFWSTIPHIEAKTARFRLLTFVVVIGGLCRLLGVMLGDPASPAVLIALAMELGVTPTLCFLQGRIARPVPKKNWTVAFSPQLDS
jgi:Domain of unknown function (DUF4345)